MNKLVFYIKDGRVVEIELDPRIKFSAQEEQVENEASFSFSQEVAFDTEIIKDLWDEIKSNKISAENIIKIELNASNGFSKVIDKQLESINYLIDYNGNDQYSERITIGFKD